MKFFFKHLKQKEEQGFTLVELMVVVAIIGILSAVAIPNFKRYQAKTKTSEAKLQLSAIYSALTSLQSDYDAFATCLEDAGYIPPSGGNYYALGFAADNSDARDIVADNGGTCTNTTTNPSGTQHQFGANKTVGGYKAAPADLSNIGLSSLSVEENAGGFTAPAVDDNGSYFIAGALGAIDSENNTAVLASQWIINENKALKEINKGY